MSNKNCIIKNPYQDLSNLGTHNSFAFIDSYFFFLFIVIETLISCLVHSRTERLVKRAKEEVLKVHLGTDWRFARDSLKVQSDSLFLSDSLLLLWLLLLFWFDYLFGFWIAARDLEEIQELLRLVDGTVNPTLAQVKMFFFFFWVN